MEEVRNNGGCGFCRGDDFPAEGRPGAVFRRAAGFVHMVLRAGGGKRYDFSIRYCPMCGAGIEMEKDTARMRAEDAPFLAGVSMTSAEEIERFRNLSAQKDPGGIPTAPSTR